MSKMLNQSAIEALYSATYLEDYLDAMENVPDDVQRQMTRMREQDLTYQNHLRDLEASMALILDGDLDLLTKKKTYFRIQQLLMNAQDVGDEKLQIMQQVQDLVDNKARQLELDKKNLDFGRDENSEMGLSSRDSRFHGESISNIKRARRARHDVIVPSILGPSILEATSFSENHNSSNIDSGGNDDNVVTITSGKGRNKIQRESQHAHSTKGTPVADRDSHSHTPSTPQATPSSSSNPHHNATPASSSTNTHGIGTSTSSSKKSSHSNNPVVAQEISSSSIMTAHHHEKISTSSIPNTPTSTITFDSTPGSSQRSAVSSIVTPRKQQHKQQQQQQQSEKKVKQKRKSKQSSDNSPIPIDPDEPTYCLCDQVSYGEMIGCDNDLCPIEWFHFSCVSLSTKPKGKWFCPKCRGDRPNIMKQKAIFLKELEKYNKGKEEKS